MTRRIQRAVHLTRAVIRIMDRGPDNLSKSILSWFALSCCLLLSAWYVKSIIWVSSQPVAISNWHNFKFVAYAFALLIGGIALFRGIRSLPKFGRVRVWLLILSVLIALGPSVWEFLKVDSCLDRGGSWNYVEFKCVA